MTAEESAESAAEGYIGSFNPNDREDVAQIKDLSKTMIKLILMLDTTDARRKHIACTHIEQAAMMAVKAIFSRAE